MRRSEALKIITRILRQPVDTVPTADLISGHPLASFDLDATDRPKPWAMHVDVLALKIAKQLPLADDSEQSPLARAEDAKRARDLGGELAVLQQGHADLTAAPWYPARPGDVVHVAYEEVGTLRAASETYLVGDAGDGLMSLSMIACTFPGLSDKGASAVSGVFVAEAADDPLYELWFEAGPHRLTIIRDGRPVHIGGAR